MMFIVNNARNTKPLFSGIYKYTSSLTPHALCLTFYVLHFTFHVLCAFCL